MLIGEYLKGAHILLALEAGDKDGAIREVAAVLKRDARVRDFQDFLEAIFEREHFSTTGIGHGVAIPHARTEAVTEIVMAFGRSVQGIDFASMDGKPVHLVFLLGTPKSRNLSRYLSVLARLTRLLERTEFREMLLKAGTTADVLSALRTMEA